MASRVAKPRKRTRKSCQKATPQRRRYLLDLYAIRDNKNTVLEALAKVELILAEVKIQAEAIKAGHARTYLREIESNAQFLVDSLGWSREQAILHLFRPVPWAEVQ